MSRANRLHQSRLSSDLLPASEFFLATISLHIALNVQEKAGTFEHHQISSEVNWLSKLSFISNFMRRVNTMYVRATCFELHSSSRSHFL